MATHLIVVTPHKSFGALIHKGLDNSRYNIFCTPDFSEAIHYVRKTNCPVAILDAELEDVELSVLDIGIALRQIRPDIQFILIVQPDQNIDISSLTPAATLTKPLSMSDLSNHLDKLTAPVMKAKNVSTEILNASWLKHRA
jgi:DNA-binding response OmpR family regulator